MDNDVFVAFVQHLDSGIGGDISGLFLDPCMDRALHSVVDHSSLCYIVSFW